MIKISIENNIAIIRLNRSEKRNALHPEMVEQIKIKLKEFDDDDEIKSLIITGDENNFCAGADLEYMDKLRDYSAVENEKDSASLAELFLQLYKFSKPTIAAVNGAAIAGGCGLASVCDFIIAHPVNSKFGYSEVKIGFIPAVVSVFLIKRVGEGTAKQLLLTGDYIGGEKALEIGFVNYLSEYPVKEAINLAVKLQNNSGYSLKLTKSIINNIFGLSVDDAVQYCIKLNTISRASEDFKNGLKKFLTK